MIKSDFPEKRRSTFPNPTVPFCQAILAESNRVESSRAILFLSVACAEPMARAAGCSCFHP